MGNFHASGHSMGGHFLLESKIQEGFESIIRKCRDLKEEKESHDACCISDTQRFRILNKKLEEINNNMDK